jgi:hypothetical protein
MSGFFVFTPPPKGVFMTVAVIASSSVLVLVITVLWAKEFRLRKALQVLLARIFNHHRKNP